MQNKGIKLRQNSPLHRKQPRFNDEAAVDGLSCGGEALSIWIPSWKELKSKVKDDKIFGVDPSAVQFLMEHTLAVSCFLLYGNVSGQASIVEEGEYDKEKSSEGERNYRLLGVVLAEETKVMPEAPKYSASDDDEEADYASDFISQMIKSSPSPSDSPSSPLNLLALNQSDDGTSDEDDKMKRLMESPDKYNK